MEIALATDDPYEVIEKSKEMNDVGCYFLDIQLEADINGIKLGSEIRKYDPIGNIIFVTSHSELTYLTFVYKVSRWILSLKMIQANYSPELLIA